MIMQARILNFPPSVRNVPGIGTIPFVVVSEQMTSHLDVFLDVVGEEYAQGDQGMWVVDSSLRELDPSPTKMRYRVWCAVDDVMGLYKVIHSRRHPSRIGTCKDCDIVGERVGDRSGKTVWLGHCRYVASDSILRLHWRKEFHGCASSSSVATPCSLCRGRLLQLRQPMMMQFLSARMTQWKPKNVGSKASGHYPYIINMSMS